MSSSDESLAFSDEPGELWSPLSPDVSMLESSPPESPREGIETRLPPAEVQSAAREILAMADSATGASDVLSAVDKIEAVFAALKGDAADAERLEHGETMIRHAREQAHALDELDAKIQTSRQLAQRTERGEQLADRLMLHGLEVSASPGDDVDKVLDAVQEVAHAEARHKMRDLAKGMLNPRRSARIRRRNVNRTQSAMDALEFAIPRPQEHALEANLGEEQFLEQTDEFFGTALKSSDVQADHAILEEIGAFLEDD